MATQQMFLVENLIKYAELIPSTENAQYPVSNLKDDRRTKVYRSTDNATNIVIDMGLARDINIFSIVDSGFGAFGFNDITLELNVSDSWAAPVFSQVVPIDALYGFGYLELPSTFNLRYARIVINGSAGYVELSKMFLGVSASIGELSFDYPVRFKQNNSATVSKNRFGQKFIDEVNTQKEISGNISTMTQDEVDPLFEMLDYASFTIPIWLIFPEGNITNNNNRINGYYYLKDDPNLNFVVGNYWNTSLNFEEGT